ncbi:hypothetical protein MKQ70_15025 [Chitinophaga sedimenti]|uniref:hypothetical protein n=1 Tax=Chitinophaga sedimenti TaxID=2033606 RepID=UPI00200510D2|nr:hypothetical protein [Chitinophaga sedimenti]MCK7556257.1 hypothetical protein [Chitinophaga sedimenti]
MRHWILVLLVCIAAGFKSQAQVSFSFVPELQGRTVDGLFQVRTMNAGARKTVNLQMTVTEKSAGLIVRIQTSAFDLMPGNNPLPASVARQAGLTFSNDKAAAVTRQSGYFLEGDYDFCFELVEGKAGGSVLAEQCFSYMLQPFSPLLLVKPADGEQTCDKRPAFFWQPLLPAVPGVQYRLALVELKPRQAKTEAMNINIPLINQRNINTPMLFFPAVNKDLEEEKVYAWQVTAYKGATMLAQSEIWEFKCQCSPEEKDSQPEAFRDIEDLARGNFYLAEGRIFLHYAIPTPREIFLTALSPLRMCVKRLKSCAR